MAANDPFLNVGFEMVNKRPAISMSDSALMGGTASSFWDMAVGPSSMSNLGSSSHHGV